MSIRMMSGLTGRVVTVLQDYLPAELDLIDAEQADGITTPDVANADYHEWDRPVIPEYPACSLRVVSSGASFVHPTLMGARIDARHRIDVMFHVTIGQDDDPLVIQKLLMRYIAGATRVLCVLKERLQTVADATAYAEDVEWAGDAIYGPADEQEEGAIVRTATLPIAIRMIEAR